MDLVQNDFSWTKMSLTYTVLVFGHGWEEAHFRHIDQMMLNIPLPQVGGREDAIKEDMITTRKRLFR